MIPGSTRAWTRSSKDDTIDTSGSAVQDVVPDEKATKGMNSELCCLNGIPLNGSETKKSLYWLPA
ncbi:hypothetical protein J31TS3_06380 [Paenibacillus lactis]|nr:hypothetical protein J31TS3_06380 [Paenibacillus lactis]